VFWFLAKIEQFSFVLIQKKQKIKASHLQRSIQISNPKRKELAALKQLFFLRIFQLIDTRFQMLMPSLNYKYCFNQDASQP
jgi:hypothetical protein